MNKYGKRRRTINSIGTSMKCKTKKKRSNNRKGKKKNKILLLKRCLVCEKFFNALRDSCPSCYEDTKFELIEKANSPKKRK